MKGHRIIHRAILVVAVAVTALALGGCPPDYPKCENDDHCKKDAKGAAINQYCLFGQCQTCAKDSHCGAGQRCNRGTCEKTCTADDQCGANEICEGASCVTEQCNDGKACSGSLTCQNRRCVPGAATNNGGGTPTDAAACERSGRVSFDFNVFDLRSDARGVLDNFAKCMQQNADWKLTIEGHADDRGTTDYNLQLGDRRASSIKDYLVRLGVDKARIKTISYGEEKPVDPAGTESAWSANRRGELVVQ